MPRHARGPSAAAVLTLLAVLALPSPALAAEEGAASARLAALLETADAEDLALDPQSGLLRGDPRHAGEFGDYLSDAWRERAEAVLRARLAASAAVDRAALLPRERIALDVFRAQAGLALRAHTSGAARVNQHLPLDHVFGQHVTFPQVSSGEGVAPYRTVADYELGLTRLDGYVTWLDRTVPMMRRGMRAGHLLTRVVAGKVVAQLDEALAAGVEGSPLTRPVQHFPAEVPPADQARLAAAYRGAVGERVLPALRRVRDFLKAEYLPAARTGAPGLAGMRDGARLYALALEQHTTTRLGADEVHRIGRAEVARLREAIDEVRREVGFEGSLAAFLRSLDGDPRLTEKTPAALLDRYRGIEASVRAQLPRLFAELPRGSFEVRAVPPEQESSAGGAYYVIGTPDGTRPGVFYVNTSNLPTRTTHRATALFLHEAIPGHHLQGSLAQEDEALPPLLRFAYNAGYGEGWALYAESLGEELGLYRDPWQRLGRLDLEIFRAARLVVDTGLHARGWSRERAIRYLLDNTTLDRAAVEQEVDRYVVWPGQACAYKLGELAIRELRARAERTLGARFDVREFHRVVLDTGAIPLPVLEAKVDAWLASVRG